MARRAVKRRRKEERGNIVGMSGWWSETQRGLELGLEVSDVGTWC